ncbi:MAG TPA: Rho termination factor N-terminal domain-containing protein [Ktedonobacteraceae bacterium]|nr:Rho termination factor N-terminal domain-containing protein [Ktedonobacteraceae bacterium]
MYDVAPGVLQRLREADIISRAGLSIASQGQEYCRSGAIHSTNRQGARLSGVVDVSNLSSKEGAITTNAVKALENPSFDRYLVNVEINDPQRWNVTCTCGMVNVVRGMICVHAAALVYQWLAHPFTFVSPVDLVSDLPAVGTPVEMGESIEDEHKPAQLIGSLHFTPTALRMPGPAVNTADILAQLPLGDLRNVAREYDLSTGGTGKQELVEAILDRLRQPEAVRRALATLEKAQRQFLATFTLAGGQMNDEELRGLFERFSFGKPEKLQQMLVALQSKLFFLRAQVNMSFQPRSALNTQLVDVTWYVPPEVRAALRIALPTTAFHIEEQDTAAKIKYAKPFQFLADLLLVARALDGYSVEREDKRGRGNTGNLARVMNAPHGQASDGSISLPAPAGYPPASLLKWLQSVVPRPITFLRFAFRVLRLSDILYIENEANTTTTSVLRMLPNAAELLLGLSRTEVLSELFTHWLQQSTYIEIFDLQDEGLLLRCRSTPMNQPSLRAGELEAENKAARQTLLMLLAQAPMQQWIDFPAFTRLIFRLNPTFLQRRQRAFATPHWWIEQEEGRPLHPTQWSDWQRAESRYIAQLLQGPLRWWGMSDIVLAEDGRLLAFRLTSMTGLLLPAKPASTALIEFADSGSARAARPVIDVSEQEDLLLPSSIENWPVIELIERFAQAQGVRNGRLCYRLTPGSLGAAFNRGESFTPLLELLRRAAGQADTGGDEQSSLALLLRRLEKRLKNYGRARFYTDATLLEVADSLVIRELAATTSFEKQIIQYIHPTLMILKKQGGEQLVEELKKRGQAPLLHGEEE